jgi:hypothetical protein
MPYGIYNHEGNTKKAREELNPTHCRCGIEWGKHPTDWSPNGMKYQCAMCGKDIGRMKNGDYLPNQCLQRYREKGNYCDTCNYRCGQKTHSSNKSFCELFKNKLK